MIEGNTIKPKNGIIIATTPPKYPSIEEYAPQTR
jgi:hypothetical protein